MILTFLVSSLIKIHGEQFNLCMVCQPYLSSINIFLALPTVSGDEFEKCFLIKFNILPRQMVRDSVRKENKFEDAAQCI